VPKLLFIGYSTHSGSTLLAFLLNTHPDIVAVGHMTGWRTELQCSCSKGVTECRFYGHIADAFRACGLPFDPTNFGTDYRLVDSFRLNRYLTGPLRFVRDSRIERLRDALVRFVPRFSAMLARQDRANLTFIKAALDFGGACVFVDKSTKPHRLRHLRRIRELDLSAIHLVRDLRGAVLTDMEIHGWDPALATRQWLEKNANITQVLKDAKSQITIHYEDIVDSTNETLATIHRFVGLSPQPFGGDFKQVEHHILGNAMRLSDSVITKDTRWQRELSHKDLDAITDTAKAFVRRNADHPVSRLVEHYLGRG
jgi:hypothetical protein